MKPWYRVVKLRKEVREGRSFSPDEFAIALEQVVDGSAPEDYRDAGQFFSRTCFTRVLKDHTGMVLRRLSGRTANTAPVVTLVTQFGGGKTHTLTALYHLAKAGEEASTFSGVGELLSAAAVAKVPRAEVGVFVGNAWDPRDSEETPWIALARQVAGDEGVKALGSAALETAPGTDAINRMFAAANAPVLLLFDEVLNFVNRHRGMAEKFHAFIQNLTVAVAGNEHACAVISLPRSQVEMTDWDQQWQERITKVVRRIAQDLIANDEAEIGEVVRRRLFEDLGPEEDREAVATTYADWCFERSHRLPSEWTAVDSATTEAGAKEILKKRFLSCYPFHPSTLSVFQRKWQALSQYQQTRGTLAMFAQWIAWAARDQFEKAREEPLITLGSAPLEVPDFRAAVLGQLGEPRLEAAIDADLAGATARVRGLDADTTEPHRDIHRRVGTAILFECSGGQVDKVARLPELRFALGETNVETTVIDNAATAVEEAGFFIRKVGGDGFRIHHQATLKKVVSDRRASLDEETEIRPQMRKLIEDEFKRGATLPIVRFPEDSGEIPEQPKLTLVVVDPDTEWRGRMETGRQIAEWTRDRGNSPRRYPGSLIWCVKKPGRELRTRVETWLAWQRVEREVAQGILGTEFDEADRSEVRARVKNAQDAAKEEVWGGYRHAVLADSKENDGLRTIDLGAGHSSANDTVCGRVVRALKTEGLLSESIAVSYVDRHWPPAFQESGAWPLTSLRQSYLDGSLTRLMDPDTVLRTKIVEFVSNGSFGLASGATEKGGYERLWYAEAVNIDDVALDEGMFLLKKETAEALRDLPDDKPQSEPDPGLPSGPRPHPGPEPGPTSGPGPDDAPRTQTLQVRGTVPPESWNRLGTKVLPKLRLGNDLRIAVELSASVNASMAMSLETELRQALEDLGLQHQATVERSSGEE